MKIAIAGAGAMGSRIGLMLHRAGNDVVLIDRWPAHIEAIREHGLQADFNGEQIVEQLPIYSPEEIDAKNDSVDLIVALTKSMGVKEMFRELTPIIKPNTYVLSLMNGLGHAEDLAEFIDEQHIILGVTMWTAGMEGPGKVKLFGTGNIELQNLAAAGTDFTKQVVQIFDKAGLNATYSENVKYSIWRKACVNGTLNGLCTILGINITGVGSTQSAEGMVKTIIAEFASVAEKEGVMLDQAEVYDHIAATYDPAGIGQHYPSMYQDLINNQRLTEIDYINGAVWSKGRKYGIATPYCAFLTELVHAKEEILGAK